MKVITSIEKADDLKNCCKPFNKPIVYFHFVNDKNYAISDANLEEYISNTLQSFLDDYDKYGQKEFSFKSANMLAFELFRLALKKEMISDLKIVHDDICYDVIRLSGKHSAKSDEWSINHLMIAEDTLMDLL